MDLQLAAERFPVMLTFSTNPQAEIEVFSTNDSAGLPKKWMKVEAFSTGPFLNKVIFPVGTSWFKIRFTVEQGGVLTVRNMGLYELKENRPLDYWVALGASLQNQSMNQDCFYETMKKNHTQADPVLFNLAVKGWGTGDLIANLPAFLKLHPHATYFLLHMGGNNISSNRPYPGGAEKLRKDVSTTVAMLQDAGKIVFLARTSYRAYPSPHPVPPEENGSGPYVWRVMDPIIKSCCEISGRDPARLPRFDFYALIRTHPNYLSDDGIHLTPLGEKNWCRTWSQEAGKAVYGTRDTHRFTGTDLVIEKHKKFTLLKPPWNPSLISPVHLRIYNYKNEDILMLKFRKTETRKWDLQGPGGRLRPGVYWMEWRKGNRSMISKFSVE